MRNPRRATPAADSKSNHLTSASLTAQRAFVVHLRPAVELDRRQFAGRVAHITSGREARFFTVADLVEFIEGIIAEEGQEYGPTQPGLADNLQQEGTGK